MSKNLKNIDKKTGHFTLGFFAPVWVLRRCQGTHFCKNKTLKNAYWSLRTCFLHTFFRNFQRPKPQTVEKKEVIFGRRHVPKPEKYRVSTIFLKPDPQNATFRSPELGKALVWGFVESIFKIAGMADRWKHNDFRAGKNPYFERESDCFCTKNTSVIF